MNWEHLTDIARLMGQGIDQSLIDTFGPKRVGFALLVFDLNDRGCMAYAANLDRENAIKALQELMAKLKAFPRVV